MDISHIQVIARVQRSEQLNSLAEPRLVINHENEESIIIVENVEDVSSSNNNQNQFSFSKCITDLNVDTEIKQSVNLALDGYDTGIIFMSTSGKDNYKERQKLRHQLLEYLDSRLDVINSLKASRSQDHIKMEFAHLGITDDSCYDLRTQRQFKNSQVLELGLDICMKRMDNAKAIWEKGKVKFGSSFSSILTIRLSDGVTFLGSVTIVDLLHPWSKPHHGSNNLFYSFDKLKNAVDQITENSFEGVISVEAFVLTKLLGSYFCGLRKTTIVMEFDQHPDKLMGDTLRALEFGQKLHNIRSTVQRNELDPRIHDYKEQLRHLQHVQEENKQLSNEKEQLQHEYQENNRILKEKLEQTSNQLHTRDALIEEMKNQIQTLEKSSKAYEELRKKYIFEQVTTEYLDACSELDKVDTSFTINRYKVALLRLKGDKRLLQDKMEKLKSVIQQSHKINDELKEDLITVQKEKRESENTTLKNYAQERNMYEKRIRETVEMYKLLQETRDEERNKLLQEHDEEKKKLLQEHDNEKQKMLQQHKERDEYYLKQVKKLEEYLDYATDAATKSAIESNTLKEDLAQLKQENQQMTQNRLKVDREHGLLINKYQQEIDQYQKQIEMAESRINLWREKAKKTATKSNKKMPVTNIKDSEEEKQVPSIQQRVLPKRGATISKMVHAVEASSDNDEGNVVTKPLKSNSTSAPPKPRTKKTKRRKVEQETQSEEDEPVPSKQEKRETRMMTRSRQENVSSSINNQEPSSDTDTGKGKQRYQGRRRKTSTPPPPPPPPPEDTQEKNNDENAGVDQSPVLEYEVDFEMPMVVLDGAPVDDEAKQETKVENEQREEQKEEEEEEQKEEEQEERSLSPQIQKPIETAPPRKKRKLRGGFKRGFDYDEHLLSPLSKVNNALRES